LKLLLKIGAALGLAVAVTMLAEVQRELQKPTPQGVEPTIIKEMNLADTQLIPGKQGQDVLLRVINGVTADTIVTIVTPNTVGGNAIADLTVEVKKEKTKLIGPLDPSIYCNAAGNIEVKFSAVTNVTLEATLVTY
jgi:hypothetical protein